MYCPACGFQSPDGAAFCGSCGGPMPESPGFQPPSYAQSAVRMSPAQPAPMASESPRHAYDVVSSYRYLLMAVGTGLGSQATMMALSLAVSDHNDTGKVMAGLSIMALALLSVAASIAALVFVYRLSSALGYNAILWVIGMLIPCVGLICLVALGSQANHWLNMRGIRVGLLGPSAEVVEQLKLRSL